MTVTFRELEAELTEQLDRAQVPGLALVITAAGEPVYERYHGARDVAKGLAVTPDTVFGMASVTKSVTALAVLQLADAGRLTVHDPVQRWLPEWELPENRRESLRIHHLLTHTGGLPGMKALMHARAPSMREDPDWQVVAAAMGGMAGDPNTFAPVRTVSELIGIMNAQEIHWLGAPGQVFNYSNESFALLQEIIERASGLSYRAYMRRHVLDPLGMDASAFRVEDIKGHRDVTELYALKITDGAPDVFHSPVWWNVGRIYANGSLLSSARDITRYLQVWSRKGRFQDKAIVSEAGFRAWMSPHAKLPTGGHYGYGVQITPSAHGVTLLAHGGSIKGVSAHVMACPERDLTVAVLTNLGGLPVGQYALAAMNAALGLPLATQPKTYEPVTLEQEQLHVYEGSYASEEGGRLTVHVRGDRLVAQTANVSMSLVPYARHAFVSEDRKVPVAFLEDPARHVGAVFLGMRVLLKVN